MRFNDDEHIVASQDVSGEKPTHTAGKIKATVKNNTTAPLEESKFKVMLELTGADSCNGVDLVTVLDVSGSMDGEKLEKMKSATLFMIKKLSPIDRLSIVTFNEGSERLCPLRQINENSQAEIKNLVNALVPNGGSNISAGLQTGLKVLNDRRLTSGRAVGIILMSDGQQSKDYNDPAQVPVGNVPVCTFGFGADQDLRVLNAIAKNSMGGTFSDVRNQDNLSIPFSQCLAGLLTVVVEDLKLTVTSVKSKIVESTIIKVSSGNYPQSKDATIVKVSSGNYPQSKDDAARSVTVSFGDLYIKQVHKVIVDLLLPAASKPAGLDVLTIAYTYSSGGKLFDANPITLTVSRGRTSMAPEMEEEMIPENCLQNAQMIEEEKVMADDNKLDNAHDKVVEAQNLLEDVVNDESNPLIEMLKSELQRIKRLMKTQEINEKLGRPFVLSSETSHSRQRYAARGDYYTIYLPSGIQSKPPQGILPYKSPPSTQCHLLPSPFSITSSRVMMWKSCAYLPLRVWMHTLSKPTHLTRIPSSHCPLWARMRSKNLLLFPLLPSLELLATIFRQPFSLSNPLAT